MPISFDRYIAITSGVGGAAVAERELIARLFTTSEELATGTIQEFSSAAQVGTKFGTSGDEYKRAAFYFGHITKSIEQAKKISFARWADAATEPIVFGIKSTYSLSSFTGVSNGSFDVTLGGDTYSITGLDFTGDASLSAVAATIEAGIQAADVATMWANATFVYNATEGRFELRGGDTGAAAVNIEPTGSGTDIIPLIGFGTGAMLSNGSDVQTITDLLADSTALNDNFGSFGFVEALTQDEIVEASEWNASTQGPDYQFHTPVSAANLAALSALTIGNRGTGITVDPAVTDEFPEMLPMALLAATDFDRPNSAKNYMFQQADLTASVTDDSTADTYDALRGNYIGQTQTAGQEISFYQRGYLCGGETDAVDMGVYANEQWLRASVKSKLMNLLLTVERIPANAPGAAQAVGVIQETIELGLTNGTIMPGKTLSAVQKLYVTNVTGDALAWYQVQNLGYWIKAEIEEEVVNDVTEYHLVYTLVYAKGDSVRKVEGRHILI